LADCKERSLGLEFVSFVMLKILEMALVILSKVKFWSVNSKFY
jgi:hypothetical protein